jgi:hypothetical protein
MIPEVLINYNPFRISSLSSLGAAGAGRAFFVGAEPLDVKVLEQRTWSSCNRTLSFCQITESWPSISGGVLVGQGAGDQLVAVFLGVEDDHTTP